MNTLEEDGCFMFLINLTEKIRLLEPELKKQVFTFSLAQGTEKIPHSTNVKHKV